MEKKFRILRIIGTLWKVLAWVALVGGILLSLGILLGGVLGSGGTIPFLFRQEMATPAALRIVYGIGGFIISLIASIVYFLILYAVGELIYLLLAIEENTRRTRQLMEDSAGTGTGRPASPPPPFE